MKIASRTYTDAVVGAEDEIAVTIEANAVSFRASISGLAENKPGYVIREIASNAWDAARGDFDVHLPTEADPTFRIRDRGPGMDDAAMRGRYTVLYASSKRDDPTTMGSWGAGRFSPFAYLITDEGASSYTVVSTIGGTAHAYLVSLHATGYPVVRPMGAFPSDEPDGFEVSFAVRKADIPRFHAAAREILWGFQPRPTINLDLGWREPQVRLSGESWTLYEPGSVPFTGPHVRMGCAVYALDLDQLTEARAILRNGPTLLFEAPIGALHPTLSREGLQYDDHTKASLEALVVRYRDDFVASVQARVDAATTYFEACGVLESFTSSIGLGSTLRELVQWRDLKLSRYAIPDGGDQVSCMQLGRNWSRTSIEQFSRSSVLASSCTGHRIVLDHGQNRSLERLAVAGLEGQPVLWIRCRRRDRETILARIGNPDALDLDRVELPDLPERPKTVRRRRVYVVNGSGRLNAETRDIDMARGGIMIGGLGQGYYASADVGQSLSLSSYDFRNSLVVLTSLGVLNAGDVILIRTPQERPQEGWVWFDRYVCQRLSPIAAGLTRTGLEGKGLSDLGHALEFLSSDAVMQAFRGHTEPADLVELVRRARRLRERIGVVRESGQDRAWKAETELRRYGGCPGAQATRPIPDPVGLMKDELQTLYDRYPLLRPILCRISSGYGAQREEALAYLGEYLRLLANQRETSHPETRQEAA